MGESITDLRNKEPVTDIFVTNRRRKPVTNDNITGDTITDQRENPCRRKTSRDIPSRVFQPEKQ